MRCAREAGAIALLLAVLLPVPVCPQGPDMVLALSSAVAAPGEEPAIAGILDNQGAAVLGLELAVCHDPVELVLLDVQPGPALGSADFIGLQAVVDGWVISVVFDLSPPFGGLPPGLSEELAVATYSVLVSPPAAAAVVICGVQIGTEGGPVVPVTHDGAIHTGPAPELFRRGDVDGSAQVGLGDAIGVLEALFGVPPAILTCPDAADFDDSGTLDLADPISILMYLFAGGSPSPLPGPTYCGRDWTPDANGPCSYDPGAC